MGSLRKNDTFPKSLSFSHDFQLVPNSSIKRIHSNSLLIPVADPEVALARGEGAVVDPRCSARDGRSPLGPIYFIFMQFLAEILKNIRLTPPLLGLAPPLGNPISTTRVSRRWKANWNEMCKAIFITHLLFDLFDQLPFFTLHHNSKVEKVRERGIQPKDAISIYLFYFWVVPCFICLENWKQKHMTGAN